jgi:uncharacterized protein (DUF1330 family)
VEKIEGYAGAPNIMVLMEFPAKEAAQSFDSDPDYKPYLDDRLAGSSGNMVLFADEDIAAG